MARESRLASAGDATPELPRGLGSWSGPEAQASQAGRPFRVRERRVVGVLLEVPRQPQPDEIEARVRAVDLLAKGSESTQRGPSDLRRTGIRLACSRSGGRSASIDEQSRNRTSSTVTEQGRRQVLQPAGTLPPR